MSKVRVSDHVRERLEKESETREMPMGAVVEGWMRDADRFETLVTTGRVEHE